MALHRLDCVAASKAGGFDLQYSTDVSRYDFNSAVLMPRPKDSIAML